MAGRRALGPALITSAKIPASLDADQRTRRYLATMAVRVACFIGGAFAPLPWNVVLFLAAAVLPAIAVVLANAIDQRTPARIGDGEPAGRRELSQGIVVEGDVTDGERGRGRE